MSLFPDCAEWEPMSGTWPECRLYPPGGITLEDAEAWVASTGIATAAELRELLGLEAQMQPAEPPPAPAAQASDSIKSYSDLVQYRAASPRAPWNDDMRAVLFEEEARRQKVLGATGVRQKLASDLGISMSRVGTLIRDHKDFRRQNPIQMVAAGLRQGCDSSEKT